MAYIICFKDAAVPLKALSPDLIVLPLLPLAEYESRSKFSHWTRLLHAVVVGPGLGRDLLVLKDFPFILENIADKIVVCDADFFWFLCQDLAPHRAILAKFKTVVFTPNFVEFGRLFRQIFGRDLQAEAIDALIAKLAERKEEVVECDLRADLPEVQALFDFFGNPDLRLIIKYKYDLVVTRDKCFVVKCAGSLKRCGGLGDILTGLAAFFSHQALLKGVELEYALVFAALVNRRASLEAFRKMKAGLIASDVLEHLHAVVNQYLDDYYEEDLSEGFRSFE